VVLGLVLLVAPTVLRVLAAVVAWLLLVPTVVVPGLELVGVDETETRSSAGVGVPPDPRFGEPRALVPAATTSVNTTPTAAILIERVVIVLLLP
jgi:hypothetical protein